MRDTMDAIGEHCGGMDRLSEVQKLSARRVGVLETEMIFIEAKLARIRNAGGEPERDDLQLYCTLANAQRRACEPFGWQRAPRDVTPDLREYIAADVPANGQGSPPASQKGGDA